MTDARDAACPECGAIAFYRAGLAGPGHNAGCSRYPPDVSGPKLAPPAPPIPLSFERQVRGAANNVAELVLLSSEDPVGALSKATRLELVIGYLLLLNTCEGNARVAGG